MPFLWACCASAICIALASASSIAIGPRGEGERHAVFEHRLRHGDDVVDRGREAVVEQRTRARHQHQRLRGARAGSPGNQLAEVAGELIDRLHADGPAALPPLPRTSPRRRAQTHSHTRNRRPDEPAQPQPGRRTNGCGQGP